MHKCSAARALGVEIVDAFTDASFTCRRSVMALPSRKQTFAYENCRDLLEKLDREIDRYRSVVGREDASVDDVDLLKDAAFNASVTAWHLGDWVFNDMTDVHRSTFGFNKPADLQDHARANCRALHLCRYAATASKHWEVTNHPDPTIQIVVTGETGWTIYFIDSGKRIAAEQVFDEALHFWTGFIYQNQIAKIEVDASG
jgi:hypothetical protein